jgi:hypothetical protein
MGEACALVAQPLLYRIRLVLMGAVEPVAEMSCSLVRGLAVEGHHGRWHARNPEDVCPPTLLGHPRHLDDVRTTSNGSFKAMPHDD